MAEIWISGFNSKQILLVLRSWAPNVPIYGWQVISQGVWKLILNWDSYKAAARNRCHGNLELTVYDRVVVEIRGFKLLAWCALWLAVQQAYDGLFLCGYCEWVADGCLPVHCYDVGSSYGFFSWFGEVGVWKFYNHGFHACPIVVEVCRQPHRSINITPSVLSFCDIYIDISDA